MGNGIAHVFAQSGFDVTLVDVSAEALQKARDTIAKNLDRQVKKGAIAAEAPGEILGRIKADTDTGAVRDAGLVIEAATENAELKYKIFRGLETEAAPDAILASNTSSISITEIA